MRKYVYKIKEEEDNNLISINSMLVNFKKNLKNKTFIELVSNTSQLKRELVINEIDEDVAESVETLIKFWNSVDNENKIPIENREPIKIYIDSYGGLVTAAFTIIDAIKLSKTPIVTVNIGKAYSAGFFIFITGNKRISYPRASFLYHEGSIGSGRMDAGKFRNYANFYERELDNLKELVLEHTKISEEEYNKHIKDDWWLMANEALDLGICDEITKEFV